jgi:transcription-repair coupling factor (superfamily II helicase)
MSSLRNLFDSSSVRQLRDGLQAGQFPICFEGLTPSAKPAYLSVLWKLSGRPLLLLTNPSQDLTEFRNSLEFYHQKVNGRSPDRVAFFPALEPSPYSGLSPHPEILEERALSFWKLYRNEVDILITSPIAALSWLYHSSDGFQKMQELKAGREISLEELTDYLLAAGYIREEPVSSVGTFSVRGGILDFFPPILENPVRVEFFGDVIESLREFSVKSQRSVGPLPGVWPIPLREWLITPQTLMELGLLAGDYFLSSTLSPESLDLFERAAQGEFFPGFEHFLPLLAGVKKSLLDFTDHFLMVVDEPGIWNSWYPEWEKKIQADYQKQFELGYPALHSEDIYQRISQFQDQVTGRDSVFLDELGLQSAARQEPVAVPLPLFTFPAIPLSIQFSTRPSPKFHGNLRGLVMEMSEAQSKSTALLLIQSNLGKGERIADILREYDFPCLTEFRSTPELPDPSPQNLPLLTIGNVPAGFIDRETRLWVLGDQDIYDEEELLSHAPRKKTQSTSFLSDFRELKPGDYIVHVDHGIGQFLGIREIAAEGLSREFMVLNYYGDDKLYVPLERMDLVQKHSSGENLRPSLDKLGGTTWVKTKARIRKSMRDMADELLKLYAARKISPGYAFSPQGHWHQEFEESFDFTETPDQMKAIQDVYQDLESTSPMDRLLCGDVGFGKTEVAMRAAFKAAFDGKQVALLAPTTILVYQHYLRFKQRFNAFPMSIEMLSRFRDRKAQKKILDDLANGQLDIVIGTHRLLSKDIQFRDLGLLVIDEEQQFGVVHKERLKHLKKHVDTLTMTATPIPRTLHMSLCGIRDMSVIETPPRDRLAIHTSVIAFNRKVVQTAIDQELERGGQVYFVHNRVDNIYAIAAMIQEICPKAKLVVGHGQMDEKRLEETMLQFVRHEADVLVSTTIIENGLDIPLVNTIIVNHADRFGLAQLYQLRGRVGRSNRRAYAYLLTPGDKVLTGEARQRLAALKEFSELGAGFKIAALDLELRGAGNLLGGEQHGHINAVGFDLYCQMLERTIEEMKGGETLPEVQATLNLKIPIKIPTSYIPDETQRLRTYKHISTLRSDAEVSEMRAELEDRYGILPEEVEHLMEYARLRLAADRCLAKLIERQKDGVIIQFHEKTPIQPKRLVEVISREPGISLTPDGHLKYRPRGFSALELLQELRSLLLDLSS